MAGVFMSTQNIVKADSAVYRATVLGQSPRCYYPMQETSGSTLADVSGNSCPNIALTGATVGQTATDNIGKSVLFDGIDDWGQTSAAINYGGRQKIAVEMLVKDTGEDNNNIGMYFESGSTSATAGQYHLGGYGQLSGIEARHTGEVGQYTVRSLSTIRDATWHHVVVVYDYASATQEIKLYVDGDLRAVADTVVTASNNVTQTFANSRLNLMARNAGVGYLSKGEIAHLAIYNDLSNAEITDHAVKAGLRTAIINPTTHTVQANELWDNGYNNTTDTPRQSPFSRFVFNTNAPRLDLNISSTGGYPTADGFVVRLDGAYYKSVLLRFMSGQQTVGLELPKDGQTHTVEITTSAHFYSGGIKGRFLDSVTYDDTHQFSVVMPVVSDRRVVVIGDSVSMGREADDLVHNGLIGLLRNTYGYSVMSEGAGSTSLRSNTQGGSPAGITALVNRLVGYSPDTVYIQHALNDYSTAAGNFASYQTIYTTFIDELHAALPNAHIVCQTMIPAGDADASVSTDGYTRDDYRAFVTDVCGDSSRPWALVVDGQAMLERPIDFHASNNLHPNTTGHAKWAGQVADILKTLNPTASLDKTTHTLNTNDNVTLTVADTTTGAYRLFNRLVNVEINGMEIAPSNYNVTEGSVVISLASNYLNGLSAGNYTVTANFTGNVSKNGNFAILAASSESNHGTGNANTVTPGAPNTGVASSGNSLIITIIIGAVLSIAGLTVAYKLTKTRSAL